MKRLLFLLSSLVVLSSSVVNVFALSANNWNSLYGDTEFLWNQQSSYCGGGSNSTPGTLSSGSNVYILGDSITEATSSAYQLMFQKDGIQVNIDAQANRTITNPGTDGSQTSGLQAVQNDSKLIQTAGAIIIQLGISGGNTPQSIDQLINSIRSFNQSSPIYWIDTIAINNPSLIPTITAANISIYNQSSTDNYSVISWYKAVYPAGNPNQPTGQETDTNNYINVTDSYHYLPTNPAGDNALANLVISALDVSSASGTTQSMSCCATPANTGAATFNSADQKQNAETIIGVAKTENLGQPGALIGLMVGLDESGLRSLANQNVPLSEGSPLKQGDGSNGTSLGIFQQQIVDNWSTYSSNLNDLNAINQLMTPAYSVEAFFGSPPGTNTSSALEKGLQNVIGWQTDQPWVAAQAVQRSGTASGSNYKNQMATAQSLLNSLWTSSQPVPLPVPFKTAVSLAITNNNFSCPSTNTTVSAYQNPLRAVSNLSGQRVDQGVDFDGTGDVYAIGNGTVTNVYNSGWPHGTFINYQLSNGPAKGYFVYVAEDCTPKVTIGQVVTTSTVLCTMFEGQNGIEMGWGANNNGQSEASLLNEWNSSQDSTGMGVNFLNLLQALGIKLTGGSNTITQPVQTQGMPANYPTWQ